MSFTHIQGSGISSPAFVSGFNISVTLNSVSQGDLLLVCVATYSTFSTSISDNLGNTYTLISGGVTQINQAACIQIFSSIITTPGNVKITVSGPSAGSVSVDEYSHTSGTLVSLDGIVSGDGTPTLSAGPLTPTSSDLFFASGTTTTGQSSVVPAGAPWNARYNSVGGGFPICTEDLLNSSSAQTATMTYSNSGYTVCLLAAFKAVVPAILPSPNVIPSRHTGTLTVNLTGLGTLWSGMPFTASGVTGAALMSQVVHNNTSATLGITTGSGTGILSIFDGTNTGLITINLASIQSVNPPASGESASTLVTITAINTLWLSENPSTLFSVSGVSGVSVSGVSVTNNTNATFTLTSSISTGTVTITDNSTMSTSSFIIYSTPPSITIVPSSLPTITNNYTLTLTGNHTTWVSNPPTFSASGVAGVTLGSPTITSNTAATIPITIGLYIGTLTITDGSFNGTMAIVPGSMISNSYVSRDGETLYWFATNLNSTPQQITSVNSNPTVSVNGHVITMTGPIWTDVTNNWPFILYRAICGGAAGVVVQKGGHSYTAPSVTASGGGGSGMTFGTPTLKNGVISGITCQGVVTQGQV